MAAVDGHDTAAPRGAFAHIPARLRRVVHDEPPPETHGVKVVFGVILAPGAVADVAHRHRKARALDLLGAAQQKLRLRAAEPRLCGVGKMRVDARELYTLSGGGELF